MSNTPNNNDKIKNSLISIIDLISNNLSDKGKTDTKALKEKLKKIDTKSNSSTTNNSSQNSIEQKDSYEQ